MAFSRYGSRGIGGLRGQFQQPQQMQQQGMQGFNLSGPRPLGPAQMQQMGAVAGDYGQRGRDAQMQALQRFNPKMRSDHRIQGFQPPQQMEQQLQGGPGTFAGAAGGGSRSDPFLGQTLGFQQHMQRMGSLPFRPRPLEEPRSTHQPPAHPQGASGMAGYAQRPSPPPPSFANAPRPIHDVGSSTRQLAIPSSFGQPQPIQLQDQLRQQPVQTPPTAPNELENEH